MAEVKDPELTSSPGKNEMTMEYFLNGGKGQNPRRMAKWR